MADELITMEQASDVLLHGGELKIASPEDISKAIAARILGATSLDDVLSPAQTTKAADVFGVPLNVTAAEFLHSGVEGGPGIYALISATDAETGETMRITCGGVNVMSQLIWMMQHDELPALVKIVKAETPTANGFYPYWLAAA